MSESSRIFDALSVPKKIAETLSCACVEKTMPLNFFWFWVRFCAAADVGVCIVCTSWRKHVKMFAFWGVRTMHSKIMCGAFLFRRDFAKHIAHGKIWCGMANVCMWCEAPMDMFNWFMFVMRFCWTFFLRLWPKNLHSIVHFPETEKTFKKTGTVTPWTAWSIWICLCADLMCFPQVSGQDCVLFGQKK